MEREEIERKRVLAIEEATTKLKRAINEGFLLGHTRAIIKSNVIKIIQETRKALEALDSDESLIAQTELALKQTFLIWYSQMLEALKKTQERANLPLLQEAISKLEKEGQPKVKLKEAGAFTITDELTAQGSIDNIRDFMTIYEEGGLGSYVDYGKMVNDAMMDISNEIADGTLTLTDSLGRKKSMRNMAEIQSRYNLISDDLERLKERGVKLVIATSHANASERCQWWQGKIYQMDLDSLSNRPMGQYKGGKPVQTIVGHIDGKPIYSLREACENGFLSFNCQHRLVAYYKGVKPPRYNMVEIATKREHTQKQRYLENRIRKWKAREVTAPTPEARARAIDLSQKAQQDYELYCHKYKLTRYDWRTQITESERAFNPRLNKK